jgi:hypothetical protein
MMGDIVYSVVGGSAMIAIVGFVRNEMAKPQEVPKNSTPAQIPAPKTFPKWESPKNKAS